MAAVATASVRVVADLPGNPAVKAAAAAAIVGPSGSASLHAFGHAATRREIWATLSRLGGDPSRVRLGPAGPRSNYSPPPPVRRIVLSRSSVSSPAEWTGRALPAVEAMVVGAAYREGEGGGKGEFSRRRRWQRSPR